LKRMENEYSKILIVDDERFNLNMLIDLLKPSYRIMAANSGQKALNAVQSSSPPDLILLDVMMPEMDGFEVCRRIKAMEVLKNIPILFITALSDTESKIKAFQVGGADYLNKPIIPEEVLARIKVHLENRLLIRDMSEANKHLSQLNQLKNQFLGMAAHDLRSPLGAITGFTELIIDEDYGSISGEQAAVLNRIHMASQRMMNLVDDLLDVSVIESGKLKLKTSKGSLKKIIEERVTLVEVIAEKKEICFKTVFQTDEESIFDQERIIQVIDNLLSNAIKFSTQKSDVEVGLHKTGEIIALWVSNQGPGIFEEEQEKIFGEFHSLSTKTTAGEKSTGLGLAISKKIVSAHQGKIHVESQPNSKTTFSVTLPVMGPEDS
jgi:two-component system, sensor histidine kinase and response regulator